MPLVEHAHQFRPVGQALEKLTVGEWIACHACLCHENEMRYDLSLGWT